MTLELRNLRQKHASVFGSENHPIADGQTAKFELKAGCHSIFFIARPAPYAMAPKAEEESDSLIKKCGVFGLGGANCAEIPVLKSDGKVRICGD